MHGSVCTHNLPPARKASTLKRILLLACAWLACGLGCIGIFIPVLPTTPLLLLATFLFAKSSPRLHGWICSTKVYKTYVGAFKQAGGVPLSTKFRILFVSYALMGVSAWVVQKPLVWVILGCVAIFLLGLLIFYIPTVKPHKVAQVRAGEPELAE